MKKINYEIKQEIMEIINEMFSSIMDPEGIPYWRSKLPGRLTRAGNITIPMEGNSKKSRWLIHPDGKMSRIYSSKHTAYYLWPSRDEKSREKELKRVFEAYAS